ncbi:MAG TPA: tRNA (adenosine(37)-N6)-threonylcarbamoyltransferase complex dimerization subunit type 1 TsaB [Chlorobaculum sp.]|nr:tRNA (adenosine(37)-N6)-threonylcarbamoyltransferase complex dimerization subunit type 1 TsaB [Chlorobaculum sp.]
MKILAIECTHQVACVAVKNGSEVVERISTEWQKTAETIVPLVIETMTAAGVGASELDGVAVSSGPGSFTALRIGMSAAKGIAFGAGRPLVTVPTMPAIAASALARTGSPHIVTVIPSRPGEYFYSIYRREGGDGMPTELESARCQGSELAGHLEKLAGNFIVVGRSVADLIAQDSALASCCVEASFFTASSLLDYAEKALSKGVGAVLADVGPDYRQQFVSGQQKQ